MANVGDDVLPIAAAGALGLLALLGTVLALRRRKRRKEHEEEYVALDEPRFETSRIPVAFAEPVREPSVERSSAKPAPARGPLDPPKSSVPAGFDMSRFGPHVQAAYRGPTEANSSLSLKNRLRRASAMDQMARNAGDPSHPVTAQPSVAAARDAGAVVSKMTPAPGLEGGFILGRGTASPNPRPITTH